MFKKGQLVKLVKNGRMYRVVRHRPDGLVVAYPLLRDGRVWWLGRVEMTPPQFELIGNNYQAKQKCSR